MSEPDLQWIQFGMLVVVLSAFIFLLLNENQDNLRFLTSQLVEDEFMIPADKRRADKSIQEYYDNRQAHVWGDLLATRQLFLSQYHVGTVMKDGFRADLPENAMWKNGKIEIGGVTVAKLRTAALINPETGK